MKRRVAQPPPRTLRSLMPMTDDSSSHMTGSTSLGLFSSVRLLTGIQSLDLTGASGATAPADRVECRLGCFSRSLIVDGAQLLTLRRKDRKVKNAESMASSIQLSWPACESARGRTSFTPDLHRPNPQSCLDAWDGVRKVKDAYSCASVRVSPSCLFSESELLGLGCCSSQSKTPNTYCASTLMLSLLSSTGELWRTSA